MSGSFLRERGVEVHPTDRGGQVTYHGPGQIVAYPICNLQGGREDVGRLVRGLEEAMIRTAADFGVVASRLKGAPGIWVETLRGPEKLGAIGLHLSRWITTHGIAFNVSPGPGSLPLDHALRVHRQGRLQPGFPPWRWGARPGMKPPTGSRPTSSSGWPWTCSRPGAQPQRVSPHLAPGRERS